MFSNLLRRKAVPATPPPPQAAPAQTAEMEIDFMHELHMRALQTLVRTGRFQGAYAQMAGFKCQTMPNGMEVGSHADKQVCAIMAENVIGISGVGFSTIHWCLVHLGTFTKYTLEHEPDWQTGENGITGTVPFGNGNQLEFRCEAKDDIDFDFSGRRDSGATLIIEVKKHPG